MTDESRALQSIFFGKQACEKNHYGKPARMPQNMAVLGAGLMGAGVATVSLFCFSLQLNLIAFAALLIRSMMSKISKIPWISAP